MISRLQIIHKNGNFENVDVSHRVYRITYNRPQFVKNKLNFDIWELGY